LISEHASPLATLGGVDAGGQNLHVAELAAALSQDGHQATVYTRRDDPDLPESTATEAGYQVVHVPAGPATALNKDELLPYMRQFGRWTAHHWSTSGTRPDVVHAHFWMSGLAAQEAVSGLGVPVVLTYHALGVVKRRHQKTEDSSPAVRIPVEAHLGRTVNRVIAQCQDEVRELRMMGVPRRNVDIVPSGVNLARFSPTGPGESRRPDRLRVLAVGRLVARKGFDDLIRAVSAIGEAELVIVGGPAEGLHNDPEARRLAELSDRLRVADRVHLVGAVPASDMPSWYRSADVVACTPWYEPFGLTPLEAMACGAPVVAYAVGGLQESVVDGVTGRHVQPGNVPALINALRGMLSDQPLRRRCGQAAAELARSRYSWNQTAARLAEVYADVVARRPEPQKVAS
jgi:glycosyltransferase involved in cell wall biosynthesis